MHAGTIDVVKRGSSRAWCAAPSISSPKGSSGGVPRVVPTVACVTAVPIMQAPPRAPSARRVGLTTVSGPLRAPGPRFRRDQPPAQSPLGTAMECQERSWDETPPDATAEDLVFRGSRRFLQVTPATMAGAASARPNPSSISPRAIEKRAGDRFCRRRFPAGSPICVGIAHAESA